MSNIPCPHCGKESITATQRIKAAHWLDVYCNDCQGRVSMTPIVLFFMYFMLMWDLFFFGFMAYVEESIIYLSLMLGGWAIMELFMFYVPLVPLKSKRKQAQ